MSDALREDRCVVRATDGRKGRTRMVTPENSAARYLHYGRIVLEGGGEPVRFATGEHETVNVLIGKNVDAGRLMAGVTFSAPGNWTSWPPHEHAALAEEAYVFIDMPPPAWGVQFVYTDPQPPSWP